MRKIIKISSARCKACGLCMKYCPVKCLEASEQRNAAGYLPVRLKTDVQCIGCGTCVLMCPEPMALELVDRDEIPDTTGDAPKPDLSDALSEALSADLAQTVAESLTPESIEKLAEMLTVQVTKAVLAKRGLSASSTKNAAEAETQHAFLKGNDAVICGAIAAGCKAFFGYPITPASEIAHDAMGVLPNAGAITIQAESEVSAINMLYGAAASGVRAMTATSGPGFSLMQEGISYMAAALLPGVIVDVMRSGPGLGNIGPEQGDYFMATRGGGHGHYHTPVFAPANVQEMFSLTRRAFDTAFKYRSPVIVLADAFIGQVMETVDLPKTLDLPENTERDWAARPECGNLVISSLELTPARLEVKNDARFETYQRMQSELPEAVITRVDSPKTLCVAYGICARIAEAALHATQNFDLFRPVTLWPFPEAQLRQAAERVDTVLVVECNRGQMLEDIQRMLPGKTIRFIGHDGGVIPTADEIIRGVNLAHDPCVG